MGTIEVVAAVSGLLNALGAVAGLFGWRHHRKLHDRADEIERAGEAVIQGVEACEQILGSEEAKQVKRSVQTAATAAGAEPFLRRWLNDLGLSGDAPE